MQCTQEDLLCVCILCLKRVFELLGQRTDAPWGVYLRVHGHQLLEASLKLLQAAYSAEELYRPIWISMESSQSSYSTNVCIII